MVLGRPSLFGRFLMYE